VLDVPSTPWRLAEAGAHEAKAESLTIARDYLATVLPLFDNVEQPVILGALEVVQRKRDGHEAKAKALR
jgi:hypothetical protein